ncbi:MAG TPA: hypothetical protein VGD66_15355 [Allosphingosinicella sp.]
MAPGARTDRLHDAVFRLQSDPARTRVTVRDVVAAAGIDSGTLYHWYGDMETLYRLSVAAQIAAIEAALAPACDAETSVRGAILAYAARCAGQFESERYRRLLYLVVRDGAARPWLPKKHEAAIVERARIGLKQAVAGAGRRAGSALDLRASAGRAFVRRLHEEIALPMLVPGRRPLTRHELRQICQEAADSALAAVYPVRAVVRGLEALPMAGRPPHPEPLPLHRAA